MDKLISICIIMCLILGTILFGVIMAFEVLLLFLVKNYRGGSKCAKAKGARVEWSGVEWSEGRGSGGRGEGRLN